MKVRLTHRIFLYLLCFLCMTDFNNGFILKAQQGLSFNAAEAAMKKKRERMREQKKKDEMRKENIKKELKRNSEYEISRSISVQLDLLNMLTFTSVPSKLIGITSTVMSQSVNMKHNFNLRNILILTMNLSSDISTFSPVLNIIAKGNKIVTNIKEWSPRYLALWNTSLYYVFYRAKYSLQKFDNNEWYNMNKREYEFIIEGIVKSPLIYSK